MIYYIQHYNNNKNQQELGLPLLFPLGSCPWQRSSFSRAFPFSTLAKVVATYLNDVVTCLVERWSLLYVLLSHKSFCYAF